jgi:hypothetical protein
MRAPQPSLVRWIRSDGNLVRIRKALEKNGTVIGN